MGGWGGGEARLSDPRGGGGAESHGRGAGAFLPAQASSVQLTAAAGSGEVAQDSVHREGLSPGLTEPAGPSLAQRTFSGVSVSTRHPRGLSDFGLVEVWPEFSWVLSDEGQAGSIISHFSARLADWDLVSAR